MNHYIHRPTPEGGETDPRFRDVTKQHSDVDGWDEAKRRWTSLYRTNWEPLGNIWRIPGSDAPSDELLALAKAEKSKCEA